MYNPVILGRINFGSIGLDVYSSLDEPIFRASDIAEGIGYSVNNTYSLTQPCEDDEKLTTDGSCRSSKNDILRYGGRPLQHSGTKSQTHSPQMEENHLGRAYRPQTIPQQERRRAV